MAVLVTADFKAKEVNLVVKNNQDYIDDSLVKSYWYNLADKYSVPVANLPDESEISPIVKLYLVNEVSIDVCNDNIGSSLPQMINDIAVDQWELRLNTYLSRRIDYLSKINSSDIYDSENAPTSDTTTSSIFNFNTYPDSVLEDYGFE